MEALVVEVVEMVEVAPGIRVAEVLRRPMILFVSKLMYCLYSKHIAQAPAAMTEPQEAKMKVLP